MNAALDLLRRHPALWGAPPARESVPTGFEVLDRLLPGGGWPAGVLTEILTARGGLGEVRLLLPVLARLTGEGRLAAWVAPPHLPYAPALAAAGVDLRRVLVVRAPAPRDGLWAAEQALGSSACGAVLAWAAGAEGPSLRRLQLAAEGGGGVGILFRPTSYSSSPSPAPLRLAVEPAAGGVAVRVLKGKGAGRGEAVLVPAAQSPSRSAA